MSLIQMIMSLTSILLALLSIQSVLASPALSPREITEPQLDVPFIIGAVAYGTPIFLQPITANHRTYWIGKPTQTFCALVNNTVCPDVSTTVLIHHGTELVHAPTIIPPVAACSLLKPSQYTPSTHCHQRNYIASTGALSFLLPWQQHPPRHAIPGNFSAGIWPPPNPKGFVGRFRFHPTPPYSIESPSKTDDDWLACPTSPQGPWQVFAALKGLKDRDVPGGSVEGCLEMFIATDDYFGRINGC